MSGPSRVTIPLPPLEPEVAAWLVDLLATLQQAAWRRDGDAIEAYWTQKDVPTRAAAPRR